MQSGPIYGPKSDHVTSFYFDLMLYMYILSISMINDNFASKQIHVYHGHLIILLDYHGFNLDSSDQINVVRATKMIIYTIIYISF